MDLEGWMDEQNKLGFYPEVYTLQDIIDGIQDKSLMYGFYMCPVSVSKDTISDGSTTVQANFDTEEGEEKEGDISGNYIVITAVYGYTGTLYIEEYFFITREKYNQLLYGKLRF